MKLSEINAPLGTIKRFPSRNSDTHGASDIITLLPSLEKVKDMPRTEIEMQNWATADSWKTGEIVPNLGEPDGVVNYRGKSLSVWGFRDTAGFDFFVYSDEHAESDHGTYLMVKPTPEMRDDLVINDLLPPKILDAVVSAALRRFFKKLLQYLPKDDE